MGCGRFLKSALTSTFLEYDTPKIVHIRSRFIGILHRVIQALIVFYIIFYVFILNKGYQYIDTEAVSGTTTKLKGVASTNSSDPRVGSRVWDTADLNIPPEENGAFFLTTNVIVTHNQSQGECTALPGTSSDCRSDADCLPVGMPFHLGHGVSTGECNLTSHTCMVSAWCPIEDDSPPETTTGEPEYLTQTKDFTVLLKNHVYFPYYKKTRSNFIESINKSYLHSCRYHHIDHPYCPIFQLKDIVSIAETKLSNEIKYEDKWFEQLALKGGVISIRVTWDCNFDLKESKCMPKYVFDRLDNYKGNILGSGYNFRYPIFYYEDGIQKRQLVKAYGILFTLNTQAKARAFDVVTFFLNLGAGFALLGVAAVLCDIFLLSLHRKKDYFKNHIYLDLTQEQTLKDNSILNANSQHTTTEEMCSMTEGYRNGGELVRTNGE